MSRPARRVGTRAGTAALAAAALAAAAAHPAAADPRRPLPLVLQEDAELLNREPARVGAALDRARALGVGVVRLTASWSRIAPGAGDARRPGAPFRPADAATYPDGAWSHLDVAVREARRRGLGVMIDIAFWAPRWAVREGATGRSPRGAGTAARYRDTPDPREYAAFATAVAARYGTGTRAVRAATSFGVWNEPNHPAFLAPQWRADRSAGSPDVYRAMLDAAVPAIRRAAPGTAVLAGQLTDIGGAPGSRGVRPLRFLRELACVDAALRPRGDGACAGFDPPRVDGVAYHPYTRFTDPGVRATATDETRLADVGRLRELVVRLRRAGRMPMPRTSPLWLTEYGYETREDDPTQRVTRADQARFIGWSTYLAWRTPGVASAAQFQLRDIDPAETGLPAGDRSRYRDFQSGVLDARGRPKPGASALALPFWPRIVGTGARRHLWVFGQVRPGGSTGGTVGVRRFAVQRWDGAARTWTDVPLDACGRADAQTPGCGRPLGGPGLALAGRPGTAPVYGAAWRPAETTDDLGVAVRTGPALGPGPYRLAWERRPGTWAVGPPVAVDDASRP